MREITDRELAARTNREMARPYDRDECMNIQGFASRKAAGGGARKCKHCGFYHVSRSAK